MNRDPSEQTDDSSSGRIVDLLFGILFLVLAVTILTLSEQSTLFASIAAALAIGGLGIEAILSAWCGKRSLLARIGPLP